MDKKSIIECCEGCKRIDPQGTCTSYIDPLAIWNIGKNRCPLATHVKSAKTGDSKMLNPLKASKKKSRR